MIDTVWITLTSVDDTENGLRKNEEVFMFGPTGIVRFKRDKNRTYLFNSTKVVASVLEDSEYIMNILRKIRKTDKVLLNKPISKRKK